MANSKISALTSATTPLAGTETLPIVQSSTTKQVSVANLTAGRDVAGLSFTGGNVKISGNTVTTTDTNGNLTLDPNGSGYTIIAAPTNGTIAQMGNLSSRTYYIKQANVGGFDNDTLIFESDSGVGQFQWKNSGATLWTMGYTGNLTPATAAKGVNFTANTPAAGMTSQLLNWYEEGSYTVTLYDAASGGNASATTVTGRYTRVGSLVTCSFSGLNGISTAGMTAGNTLYISLPFTASSTGIGTGSFACENISFGVLRTNAIPVALNSNSRAIFRAYGSGTSSASLIVSNITSGSANIDYFTLTYRA
jgi:hypothetical protein